MLNSVRWYYNSPGRRAAASRRGGQGLLCLKWFRLDNINQWSPCLPLEKKIYAPLGTWGPCVLFSLNLLFGLHPIAPFSADCVFIVCSCVCLSLCLLCVFGCQCLLWRGRGEGMMISSAFLPLANLRNAGFQVCTPWACGPFGEAHFYSLHLVEKKERKKKHWYSTPLQMIPWVITSQILVMTVSVQGSGD